MQIPKKVVEGEELKRRKKASSRERRGGKGQRERRKRSTNFSYLFRALGDIGKNRNNQNPY